ncbi:pyridoxal phosphate-dependent aminotransferase [Glycomyces rhizosphaerae]|uniref:Pyridoxal phosphate-dependent aminotransferase n=1 Tax=Glycomyces rhizosphaerae TaxID=2054422 RepID=A0ABV7Q7T0_9ACTN
MNKTAAPLADLTQYEMVALESSHNLADAHAHQWQSAAERDVIDMLPKLWDESQTLTQAELDRQFLQNFFDFHGQTSMAANEGRSWLSYAASISMGIIATHLRLSRKSVTLIEPCFDNLYELLAHNELEVSSLPEDIVFKSPDAFAALALHEVGDALILVDPNNPTGSTSFVDDGERFRAIVRFCARHGKTLILDFSFASFLRGRRPDVYEILDDSGVTYLCIEDTGKTWPTLDIKCGILTVSADIRDEVRDLHTAVLLNVSPFAVRLLADFVTASKNDGFASVADVLDANRQVLADAIEGTELELVRPDSLVSVAWLRLHRGTATDLQERLAQHGVHVLPGTHFFWSDHRQGESYVRVALARDPEAFARSAAALRKVLTTS